VLSQHLSFIIEAVLRSSGGVEPMIVPTVTGNSSPSVFTLLGKKFLVLNV
jgi:hypothetical protein